MAQKLDHGEIIPNSEFLNSIINGIYCPKTCTSDNDKAVTINYLKTEFGIQNLYSEFRI